MRLPGKMTHKITNRTIVLTAVIGSLLIMAMVTANSLWASRQADIATGEAVSAVSSFYLEEMADRRAQAISSMIDSSFDEMQKAVEFIDEEHVATQEELRNVIGRVQALLGLHRFAVVDTDNVVYTQYTTYTGGSRHPFLANDRLEDKVISTVTAYGSSKQLCLAIPTPGLSLMGKAFKACFVQMDISEIVKLLAFDDSGRTSFALYSKSGANLSDTELGPVIEKRNFFDALRGIVPEDVWNEQYESFQHEAPGIPTFDFGESEETLCYVPIEGTGWEMVVLIRESVIQNHIRDISERSIVTSQNQIVFTLVSVLVLAVILLWESAQVSKGKIAREQEASKAFQQMANTDALTGAGSKNAYSEREADINQLIADYDIEELAVVVCDINGLKHVNDTQGHAAGDQLIKDACALIRAHFPKGDVYRVGGDEFVVLLQGEGYASLSEDAAALNREVEAHIETGEVVVSIGWSVLGEADPQLRVAFERADQMMYERKMELKGLGAQTRDDGTGAARR